MTNDLQQRAKTWHFEHLPLERDDWTPSERLAHFAAAEIARERAEIVDELNELATEPLLRAKLWAYANKLRAKL